MSASCRASIVVLPGDGIGPEVTAQATRILDVVAERYGHRFEIREGLVGGCAIDASGVPLPHETIELTRLADAVLLGAVGGPRWSGRDTGARPEDGLLALRKSLGVFANLRPVKVHPQLAGASPIKPERLVGADIMFVRELTGGIYFGEKSRQPVEGGYEARDACVYTSEEIVRVVRVAAEIARHRRGRLTSVDKANVLETSRLWREETEALVRAEFPEVHLEHVLVDAFAMRVLQQPTAFDVVVTENMFGDILTDEAAVLAGSIGVLPSASLGAGRKGLYEPIHGSAPDIADTGAANPIGAILSVAMLLRHSLGLEREACAVERAVHAVLADGWGTRDLIGDGAYCCSTARMGELVAERVCDVGG